MRTNITTDITAKSRKLMHDCDPKGLHANWAKAQTVDFCKKSIEQSIAMLTYISKAKGAYSVKGAEDVTDAKGVLAAYKQVGKNLSDDELNAVAYQLDRYAVRLYNRGNGEARAALLKSCGLEKKPAAPAKQESKPNAKQERKPKSNAKQNDTVLLDKLSELVTITKQTSEQVTNIAARLDSVEQRVTALEQRKKPGPKPGSKRNTGKTAEAK